MINVAIVGCTGVVGQQAITDLHGHPWFKITKLAASKKSSGKRFADALKQNDGSNKWFQSIPIPSNLENQLVEDAEVMDLSGIDMVFSTVSAHAAKVLEPIYAQHVPVVSTSSAFRYEQDTPIIVGGVNMDHIQLLDRQRIERGWKGFVVPKPNCTTAGLVMALKPILDRFGISRVAMTSFQAISGAGRSTGVIGLDLLDNVIPYIYGEEEKAESEPLKILGAYTGNQIVDATFAISATCTRVPVIDGHLVSASIETCEDSDIQELVRCYHEFGKNFLKENLPSSPPELIRVLNDPYRPQPRLDRETGAGMTVSIGRIRKDPLFGSKGIKLFCLSHNTKYGAAKGLIQTAEYLAKNYLKWPLKI